MSVRRKKEVTEAAFSRREREIMDILYTLGSASGQEVQARLSGEPSYSTVRTLLRVLETKGHVTHTAEDLRYVYRPAAPRDSARRSALNRLVHTFFEGSAKQAVAAFLDPGAYELSRTDLEELSEMIRKAKEEAR